MRYLYEAYTPEMDRIFRPYLKEIADKLSRTNISIQDAEFTEIELPKPVALSSVNKVIRAQYEVYGNFDCVLALLKHSTGGVTVGTFENTGRGKVTSIIVYDEYGDTDGKVTDVFVAELTKSDYRKLGNLRTSRASANAPYKDSHDISGRIKAQMSYFDNPVLKEVVKRAKAAGVEDIAGKFYSCYYGNNDSALFLNPSAHLLRAKMSILQGQFNDYIRIEASRNTEYGGHSRNDNLEFVIDLNAIRLSDIAGGSETLTDIKGLVKNVDKFIDNLEKINDFVQFLNSLTYGDILWDA